MKILALLLACLPAFALSNAVTINNLSATAQTSRTWAIHRYFADKEICGQPQPFTGGSALTYWQSDVTSRWPADGGCSGGYVKTAMISFELSVAGSSSAVVEFRASSNSCNLGNTATCVAAGASRTDLLNFDAGGGAGSWGLKVSATTGGITMERSARTMLAADQYQILKNGPLFTEVLVREGPQSVQGTSTRATSFGWKCTNSLNPAISCVSPYAANSTWTDNSSWYSIRPTFLLRFYRRWRRVEGDSILQNSWIDRHTDQRMDSYAVKHGSGETTSCYTAPAAVVIPGRSTVWDGPCWSTDPVDSTNTKIDLNTAYLIYSKAVPEYDPANTMSANTISAELNSTSTDPPFIGWNTSDKGATTTTTITPHLGWGQWQPVASMGGNAHWVGALPRGSARYLLSMDNSMLAIVMGGAKAYMHFPLSNISPLTSTFWTGYSRTSYGQPISLLAHPTFTTSSNRNRAVTTNDQLRDPSGTQVTESCKTCMSPCVFVSSAQLPDCSDYSTGAPTNKFGYDGAHASTVFFVAWLATGKHFLTEAMWQQAVANAAGGQTDPNAMNFQDNERVGTVGYIFDPYNTIRTLVWTLRVKAAAAVATPDAFDAEKAYFSQMVTRGLAIDEGRMGVVDGAYPPPDPTNANGKWGCPTKSSWLYPTGDPLATGGGDHTWCIGRYMIDHGRTNPVGFPHWSAYNGATQVLCSSCNQGVSKGGLKPWMASYAPLAYGMLVDWGFPAQRAFDQSARYMMSLTLDSGGVGGPATFSYTTPMIDLAATGYLQSWAAVKSARMMTTRLARAINSTDGTFLITTAFSYSQGNEIYDSVDLYEQARFPVKIGSEIVDFDIATDRTASATVDPSTDVLTSAGHAFQTGDLVRATRNYGGDFGLPLSVVDAGSMCLHGKYACDLYVNVLSSSTLELYLDSARTQKVDWTAADTNLYLGQALMQINGWDGYHCPKGGVCRGSQGTAATTHAVGETVDLNTPVLSSMRLGPQGAHGSNFYAALAAAAERGTTIVDSVTGKTVTAARVFETYRRWYYGLDQFGGNAACTNTDISNCNNPLFGYKPRGTPGNVRLVGSNLLYTAPDGGACKYAFQSTPFASTDDSGDTASITGPRARSITLSSGTQYYRISCGGAGRAVGQVTAP